ncbi:MAG TPA: hypothetical protein VFK90_11870, partial [Anaeromyxobacter sp.]|nr:hypothetical protein [Anaeromyxobacter sp.]
IAAALAFAACGKSHDNTKPSATATVGPAGATLSTGAATLTVPAGALAQPTQITVSEAEPHHAGRTLRVEIEPHGLALAAPARLAVRFDDSNAKVKLVDDNGTLHSVEVEDRNHGEYKTPEDHLGEMEVELEHGAACTPACTTGQECEDGVCKAHVEHPEARSCSPVCETGQECDDGTCKAHSEVEPHDVGTTCVPSCASGLHCDNGVCHT